MDERPIIALDIDGVLLPFGQPIEWNPQHGTWLQELSQHAELIWATSWMHQANWEASPSLGLPELPVVAKTDVPAYGRPRRLAWVDDMFCGTVCPQDVLDALTGRDTMFFGVNPRTGFDYADYKLQKPHHSPSGVLKIYRKSEAQAVTIRVSPYLGTRRSAQADALLRGK